MKRFSVAMIGLLALAGAAVAAERTIKITGPGCDYQVRFDPGKFDPKQVQDAGDILFAEAGLPSPEYTGRATTDAVTEAMVRADHARCLAPLARAKGLTPLDLPGLKDILARRIEAIEDGCEFQAIHDRALVTGASPKILLEHKASVAACGHFAQALETPAATKALWRAQIDRRCADNASPAQCRKSSLALESKPDSAELIRRDLIAFDWNNCANALTKLSVNQDKDEAALESLRKAFRKQFKVREKCEEG